MNENPWRCASQPGIPNGNQETDSNKVEGEDSHDGPLASVCFFLEEEI